MKRTTKPVAVTAIALAAIVALSGCAGKVNSGSSDPGSPTVTTVAAKHKGPMGHGGADLQKVCYPTWPIEASIVTGENHRWFEEGIIEIKQAKTADDARAAFKVWFRKVEKNAHLLSATYALFTHKSVGPSSLVDADGCGTELASQVSLEIRALGAAALITPGEAPKDGFNSGVDNGTVVGSPFPGIEGDRTAIMIVLPDGTVIWIMARCGNAVTPGHPYLPPGKTDEKNQWENIDHWLTNVFYANGGPTNSVNWNNGATDAQGYQGSEADVAAAQQQAEQQANSANSSQQQQAEQAAEQAGQTQAGQDPNKGMPNEPTD